MAIDLNTIKCGCSFNECLVGFRFDTNPDVIVIQDRNGKDSIVYLSKCNVNQLLNELKAIKKLNKW